MVNETIKVLVVDGEQDFLLIRNLLARTRGAQFELRWSQDLDEGSQPIADEDYDICLIDARILAESGHDHARRSLLVRRKTPLIVLTEQDEYRPDLNAVQAGAVSCLVKNRMSANTLERAIRNALKHQHLEDEPLSRTGGGQFSLDTVIASLSVGLLVTDPRLPDNPLVFVNPAFMAITGYTADEALGRNARFLQHPESDPAERQAIHDALQERRPFKGIMLNRRKDGTPYQNGLVICPVFDEDGELMNFVGLTEDVTAQYQSQQELKRSEQRYAGIVSNMPGMIYRARRSPDGALEFLYVSEGSRELFGIGPNQFQADADTLKRLVHPEERRSYASVGARANAQAEPWRWQGRFVLPTREEKIIEGLAHPDRLESGDVIWDGLLLDVTERVRAQENAARLAAIVEGSYDAILGKTLDGIVTNWNHAAETLYGYTAEEMIGQPIARLLPPDRPNEVTELIQRIVRGEHIERYETKRCAKDGTLLDISLTISPIRDSADQIIGASTIAHDITELKRLDVALAASALKNERIAETLQRSMLLEFPEGKFPGMIVETLYQAALNESEVGGDFFDAFALSTDKIALVVGDVSGKGLLAAGSTAEVKYALRAFLHAYQAPELALAHLNDFVCDMHGGDTDDKGTFIILALTVVDTTTGETSFSNAGAEPTLILRSDGTVEPVPLTGWVIGIQANMTYPTTTLFLSVGETIVMTTDGITEARHGNEFLRSEGLAALAERAGPTVPLGVLSKAIYDGARDFADGHLHDDVCVLVARRHQ